ncbi:hypothetical protein M2388_002998 [Leucobacter aridicollis]|nr:hypothetical protein [Leucobacter aridicollis]
MLKRTPGALVGSRAASSAHAATKVVVISLE